MYLDTLYISTECSENFVFHFMNLNPVLVKKKLSFILNILCLSSLFECTVIPMKHSKTMRFIFFIEI